jgi:tetratricopeptide (TPR) repeat protein
MSPNAKSPILRWGWMTVIVVGISTFAALPAFSDDQQAPATQTPTQQQQSMPVATQQPPVPPPLVSLTTGTAEELSIQGDQLRAQKRYLDAVDYYDAAFAKQPTALLLNKKGIALLFLQRNKEAQKCFEKAVALDKNSAEGLNNLGFIAQVEKRYNRAIKYYQKALAVRPNSPTFHYNLGAAYFSKHQFDKAAQEYHTAYTLDPEIFQRVSKTGIMAQSSSPQDRAAFSFMVAKMYAQAGDVGHSLEYLRKAMEEGYPNINKVYTDSEFATLRTDPRFADLMTQKPQAIQ